MTCDCDHNLVPGALFPMASDGDDSLPYVERCDDCKRFDGDWDAAVAVALAVGGQLCRAYDDPQQLYFRPFVLVPEATVNFPQAEDVHPIQKDGVDHG